MSCQGPKEVFPPSSYIVLLVPVFCSFGPGVSFLVGVNRGRVSPGAVVFHINTRVYVCVCVPHVPTRVSGPVQNLRNSKENQEGELPGQWNLFDVWKTPR